MYQLNSTVIQIRVIKNSSTKGLVLIMTHSFSVRSRSLSEQGEELYLTQLSIQGPSRLAQLVALRRVKERLQHLHHEGRDAGGAVSVAQLHARLYLSRTNQWKSILVKLRRNSILHSSALTL